MSQRLKNFTGSLRMDVGSVHRWAARVLALRCISHWPQLEEDVERTARKSGMGSLWWSGSSWPHHVHWLRRTRGALTSTWRSGRRWEWEAMSGCGQNMMKNTRVGEPTRGYLQGLFCVCAHFSLSRVNVLSSKVQTISFLTREGDIE